MPIFDELVPSRDVWPVDARWPFRRAMAVMERFQATFPDIRYDLYWNTRLANAQAFIGAQGRAVRLYGGLGRHKRIGVAGLALALAHETGHHRGGAPRHPFYASLSSEERASEWAITTGLCLVFGDAVARRYVAYGCLQLAAVSPRFAADSNNAGQLLNSMGNGNASTDVSVQSGG